MIFLFPKPRNELIHMTETTGGMFAFELLKLRCRRWLENCGSLAFYPASVKLSR
jgi:hypothetical protein